MNDAGGWMDDDNETFFCFFEKSKKKNRKWKFIFNLFIDIIYFVLCNRCLDVQQVRLHTHAHTNTHKRGAAVPSVLFSL